jgi:hypothetical protein
MRYDAGKALDPEEWLELDEQERIDAVMEYHRRNRLQVGQSAKAHAATHVVVENQAAMGDSTAVPATLARLMREGLERHDAIHAIGSVLMGIIFDMSTKHRNFNAEEYSRALAALTAEGWRSQE